MDAVDRRSKSYRAVMQFRNELVADLGGEENLSTQQLTLVDLCARELLFLGHADSFLMAQGTLLGGRGKQKVFIPLVRERGAIANRLAAFLAQLGLERRAKPMKNAIDIIRESEGAS